MLILPLLALAGCSDTLLLSKNGVTVAAGKVEFRAEPPHRLTITLDGKTYRGEVESARLDNKAALRERFGANSKRYRAIASGLDASHNLYRYKSALTAADGTPLACDYLSAQAGRALGTCVDVSGQRYEVRETN